MGFIVFGIVFFIVSILFRAKAKALYDRWYNRRLDRLHAYAKGGRKPLFMLIWGVPVFTMSRSRALEEYWNLLELKEDVMKSFYFSHFIQTSIVSILAVLVGVLKWM